MIIINFVSFNNNNKKDIVPINNKIDKHKKYNLFIFETSDILYNVLDCDFYYFNKVKQKINFLFKIVKFILLFIIISKKNV